MSTVKAFGQHRRSGMVCGNCGNAFDTQFIETSGNAPQDWQRELVTRFINEWCVLTESPATPDAEVYVVRDKDLWTNFCIWLQIRRITTSGFYHHAFYELLQERGLELNGFFWHGIGMPFRKGMVL